MPSNVVPPNGHMLREGLIRILSMRDHVLSEDEDGSPFFWWGDTFWVGRRQRLKRTVDFPSISAGRFHKAFPVIHSIAQLYPVIPPIKISGANEACYPWQENY